MILCVCVPFLCFDFVWLDKAPMTNDNNGASLKHLNA